MILTIITPTDVSVFYTLPKFRHRYQ